MITRADNIGGRTLPRNNKPCKSYHIHNGSKSVSHTIPSAPLRGGSLSEAILRTPKFDEKNLGCTYKD